MKEEIDKICTKLNDGQIRVVEATKQLLLLFSVSKQSEHLVCGRNIKTCVFYENGKCKSNDYCKDQVEQNNCH